MALPPTTSCVSLLCCAEFLLHCWRCRADPGLHTPPRRIPLHSQASHSFKSKVLILIKASPSMLNSSKELELVVFSWADYETYECITLGFRSSSNKLIMWTLIQPDVCEVTLNVWQLKHRSKLPGDFFFCLRRLFLQPKESTHKREFRPVRAGRCRPVSGSHDSSQPEFWNSRAAKEKNKHT